MAIKKLGRDASSEIRVSARNILTSLQPLIARGDKMATEAEIQPAKTREIALKESGVVEQLQADYGPRCPDFVNGAISENLQEMKEQVFKIENIHGIPQDKLGEKVEYMIRCLETLESFSQLNRDEYSMVKSILDRLEQKIVAIATSLKVINGEKEKDLIHRIGKLRHKFDIV